MSPSAVEVASLRAFARDLLAAAGVGAEAAAAIAEGFLQADLLGFHTHGLLCLPQNLDWIRSGATRVSGEPQLLSGRGAVRNADADYLAGALAMGWACELGIALAREHGVGVITLRKSQHIGALAPYLLLIAEAGFAAFAMVSTPEESLVTVEGAREALFSTNPFGFAFPADPHPLLLDMSLAVTSGGRVRMTEREGRRLPGPWILDANGEPSDEPAAFDGGMLLPIGAPDHAHKGSGLLLWSEVFSSCLGGWGRLDRTGDDDANSVYLAVHDPEAFGGAEQVRREVNHVVSLYSGLAPRESAAPPRVAGARALQQRERALREGLSLPAPVCEALARAAAQWGVPVPPGVAGGVR